VTPVKFLRDSISGLAATEDLSTALKASSQASAKDHKNVLRQGVFHRFLQARTVMIDGLYVAQDKNYPNGALHPIVMKVTD